jgi:hypothetical protein
MASERFQQAKDITQVPRQLKRLPELKQIDMPGVCESDKKSEH